MRAMLFAVACTVLGACVSAPPAGNEAPPTAGECKADAAEHLVGTRATADVGADLMRLTGARTLRWVPPRTAVTMDFRYDRLTVSYDDDMVITRISCT